MKQANHAAASSQLNQQQFHPRPVLEGYWKRPHEPLPCLANVENTDDPAEKREKPVPAHYELLRPDWSTTMDTRLHIPHTSATPKSERDRESLKSLALIDEAVFSDVRNEGFDEERE